MKYFLFLFGMISLSVFGQDSAHAILQEDKSYHNIADSEKIHFVCEQMPKFNGDMYKYLQDSTRYPQKEMHNNVMGVVYLTFVVERNGSISGVKVLKGVHNGPGLDSEAIRVVSSMPKWIPGIQSGQTVRVQYNLPIHFELKENTAKRDTNANKKPVFIGNIHKYFTDNIHYPDSIPKNSDGAILSVSFVIEKNGSTSSVSVKDSDTIPKPFIDEVQRVIIKMPKWVPGIYKGNLVRVRNEIGVCFLPNKIVDVNTVGNLDTMKYSEGNYTIAQKLPKFRGDFNAYISSHIIYPETERDKGITGPVYITFVIEKDGSVNSVKVLRGVKGGPGLDQEAIRVISSMPPWIPGSLNEHPVRVQMNLPIYFFLR